MAASPFEQAVLPHLNAAYNLARWLTRNDHDAEDVVQDAYLRALRFFGSFRGDDARGWLLAIVRNTSYDFLRRHRPQELTDAFDEEIHSVTDDSETPEVVLLRRADQAMVRHALEMLPLPWREIVILREFEGLSYKQIADVAGIKIGTVMSRLARARAIAAPAGVRRDQGDGTVNCDDVRSLIHPYRDGELDLMRQMEIDDHLRQCEACPVIYESQRALQAALREDGLYFTASPHLQRRAARLSEPQLHQRGGGPRRSRLNGSASWPPPRLSSSP